MKTALSLALLLLLGGLALSAVGPPRAPDWGAHPVNEWVRQSPRAGRAVPAFLYEGSGDYDPFARRWLHHAGHDGIPQGFHTFSFDLDRGEWRQHFPPTSPPGVCCVDGSNVFDLANRRFVRFPGGSLGHGFQWSRGVQLGESCAWLYDPATNVWTNMRPPPYARPPRTSLPVGGLNSTAAYVSTHEVVVTFGGQGNSGGRNTLHAYDAHDNRLVRLGGKVAPPARDGHGMAYDPRHDKLVLFGSQYIEDERTWIYDFRTNTWEGLSLTPHPPAKKVTKDYSTIPRLAYDPINVVILCVAWLNERGHETWAFDVGARRWTKLSPRVEPAPSKSRSRNLGFDPARNLFILETSGAKSNRPEIWTYRYRAVRGPDTRSGAPPADLRVVIEAGGKALLTWRPSARAKRYEIYRALADEPWKVDLKRLAVTAEARYQDSGLERPASGAYFYAVKAVDGEGRSSDFSVRARTRPRAPSMPVVSVLAKDRGEVRWEKHPAAADVAGYHLYRGVAHVRTVSKGEPKAWRDNDPAYDQPQVVQVHDITRLTRLNDRPLAETTFTDRIDLTARGPEAGEHAHAVHAYLVRAVNRLGVESGPSPYALTLPSAPAGVLCREQGEVAELKWAPNPEKGIACYHVYRLQGTWSIARATERPLTEATWKVKAGRGTTRFWVTAIDRLGQEGQPSVPVWFNKSYRGFYEGAWHQ